MNTQEALLEISRSNIDAVFANASDETLIAVIDFYNQYFQNINNLQKLFEINADLDMFKQESFILLEQEPLKLKSYDRETLQELVKTFLYSISQVGSHFYHLHAFTELLKEGKVNPSSEKIPYFQQVGQTVLAKKNLQSFSKESVQSIDKSLKVITHHLSTINQHLQMNHEAAPTAFIPSLEAVKESTKKIPDQSNRAELEQGITAAYLGFHQLNEVSLKFANLCNSAIMGEPFLATHQAMNITNEDEGSSSPTLH